MGVPTSEVGYTAAMSRREDHEVHKDMWWHWTQKKIKMSSYMSLGYRRILRDLLAIYSEYAK